VIKECAGVAQLANRIAGVAQLVELQFSKLNVASSSLVARSRIVEYWNWESVSAHVAQW
jgi:hypothetical protein